MQFMFLFWLLFLSWCWSSYCCNNTNRRPGPLSLHPQRHLQNLAKPSAAVPQAAVAACLQLAQPLGALCE